MCKVWGQWLHHLREILECCWGWRWSLLSWRRNHFWILLISYAFPSLLPSAFFEAGPCVVFCLLGSLGFLFRESALSSQQLGSEARLVVAAFPSYVCLFRVLLATNLPMEFMFLVSNACFQELLCSSWKWKWNLVYAKNGICLILIPSCCFFVPSKTMGWVLIVNNVYDWFDF